MRRGEKNSRSHASDCGERSQRDQYARRDNRTTTCCGAVAARVAANVNGAFDSEIAENERLVVRLFAPDPAFAEREASTSEVRAVRLELAMFAFEHSASELGAHLGRVIGPLLVAVHELVVLAV